VVILLLQLSYQVDMMGSSCDTVRSRRPFVTMPVRLLRGQVSPAGAETMVV
jgi:hypothetical protein